jgi:hypothetical protein
LRKKKKKSVKEEREKEEAREYEKGKELEGGKEGRQGGKREEDSRTQKIYGHKKIYSSTVPSINTWAKLSSINAYKGFYAKKSSSLSPTSFSTSPLVTLSCF